MSRSQFKSYFCDILFRTPIFFTALPIIFGLLIIIRKLGDLNFHKLVLLLYFDSLGFFGGWLGEIDRALASFDRELLHWVADAVDKHGLLGFHFCLQILFF